MNLSALEARINKIAKITDQLDSKDYSVERDNGGNLIILFKNGNRVKLPRLKLRPYQSEVQTELYINKIKRFFLVRPRRAGKEVESWNMIIQGAIERPGLYMQIYPTNVRARIVLWEGSISLPNGGSLKFLDMLPKSLILKINNQDMSITLVNGSVIRVIGSDIDPDKLRGVNVLGAVFSEYAFSDPRVLHILMPVFRQNDGWFILQTTFNGMNHAYRYMQEVRANPDWYCRVDSVESLVDEQGKRYVTDEMIEDDRRSGMPEFMIQQEYYSIVQLNQESLYFANELNVVYKEKRIISDLVLPNKRIYMHMDIGWNDKCAVILEQLEQHGKPNIVSYTEDNNKRFEYYVRWAEMFCVKHGLVLSKIFAPHDGQKHDFNTGKNTVDFGRDLGYEVLIVPKPSSKFNAIQSMRRMIYQCRFNKGETDRLIDCMSNYAKEFDIKNGVYKDEPLHNWASHGVDAFQTMTLAHEADMLNESAYDIIYYNS